jgi:uncharacterized repeat protein (TIGR01451 family)
VTEADLPGPLVNTATVQGTPPTGEADKVTDSDSVLVTLTSNPDIAVVKEASTAFANIGETITYDYTVTNTGDVTLSPVTLTDDLLGPISLGKTTLAPGESTTGSATHLVTEADLPGPIFNVVTAKGTPPAGPNVADLDLAFVVLTSGPAINVVKEASVTAAGIGETITYDYTVINTGDVTLHSVTLTDDLLGPISLGATTLAPGANTTGSATHLVTEADLPGPLVNTATAQGIPPTGVTDRVTDTVSTSVDLLNNPDIAVLKEASTATANVGETITYDYAVTNTGDVTLNPVTLTDDILGQISLGATALAPGESTTGSATHLVSDNDLPGPLVNIATARGVPPTGAADQVTDTASASVDLTSNPNIEVTNKPNFSSAKAGQTIIYNYTVTNMGDVTLNPVTLTDDQLGPITLGATSLAPGASTTGSATHRVVDTDLPGPFVNVATARGKPPAGPDVIDTARASVTLSLNYVYLPAVLKNFPLILNFDFETGTFEGWQAGGVLGTSISTTEAHSGSRAALLGNPSYPCTGVPVASAWMRASLEVPDSPTASLTFWYRNFSYDANPELIDRFDSFDVLVDGNLSFRYANQINELSTVCAKLYDSNWRQQTIDLSAYRGQTITIEFQNHNRPDKYYDTWTYVDDIILAP